MAEKEREGGLKQEGRVTVKATVTKRVDESRMLHFLLALTFHCLVT